MPRTHGNVFLRFLYCLLFSRESRITSSLLETTQKTQENVFSHNDVNCFQFAFWKSFQFRLSLACVAADLLKRDHFEFCDLKHVSKGRLRRRLVCLRLIETINVIEKSSKGILKRIWRHWVKITYSVLIKRVRLYITSPAYSGLQKLVWFLS